MKQKSVIAFVSMVIFLIAQLSQAHSDTCLHYNQTAGPYDEWGFPVDTRTDGDLELRDARDEMDLIYSLLTYAVVYKTWQGNMREARDWKIVKRRQAKLIFFRRQKHISFLQKRINGFRTTS